MSHYNYRKRCRCSSDSSDTEVLLSKIAKEYDITSLGLVFCSDDDNDDDNSFTSIEEMLSPSITDQPHNQDYNDDDNHKEMSSPSITDQPHNQDDNDDDNHQAPLQEVYEPVMEDQGQPQQESSCFTSEAVLKLTQILPERIEERVLASPHDLHEQLEVTVEKRLEQWQFERTRFETLDMELPPNYAKQIQNDTNLLRMIFSLFFNKIKESTVLKLPNIRVDILSRVINKNRRNLGKYMRVDIPFVATADVSVIINSCFNLIKIFDASCSTQEIYLNSSSSTEHDDKIIKTLKSKTSSHFPKDADGPLIKYNSKKVFPKGKVKAKQQSLVVQKDMQKPSKKPRKTDKKPSTKPNQQRSDRSKEKRPSLKSLLLPSTSQSYYTFDENLQGLQLGDPSSVFTAYDYWNIGQIHSQGIKGEGVTVAVVDSGVDSSHPAFQRKSIDYGPVMVSLNTIDYNGHGTMCAGILCGESFHFSVNTTKEDMKVFPPGIAPDATLVVYKVFPDDKNIASSEVVCQALDHIVRRNDINVVSLSLGSLLISPHIATAVTKLVDKGIIVVCAASNYGHKFSEPICFPARLGHVLSVGSHGPNGKASPFSPVGQQIDFVAPGEGITAPTSRIYNRYIGYNNGTSFAAPAVAGLVCLILGYINKHHRDVVCHFRSHWVIKELIREMSTSPGRHSDDHGYGALTPIRFFDQPERFMESILKQIDQTPLLENFDS